jgi:hypothetical protein
MKVGVTGSRYGMSEEQFEELTKFFKTHNVTELHHGDCAGVDIETAMLAESLGIRTVCHPPESDFLRAFHKSTEIKEQYGYLRRDKNIVDATEFMLVIPCNTSWQPKGGTWYTHDYAVKKKKPLQVIWPIIDLTIPV